MVHVPSRLSESRLLSKFLPRPILHYSAAVALSSPTLCCHPQESIKDPIIIISLGSMFAFHFFSISAAGKTNFCLFTFEQGKKLSLLEKKWSLRTNARHYSITAKLHVYHIPKYNCTLNYMCSFETLERTDKLIE